MDKFVYLFELDSVRKTDDEIYKGQLALYDELVGNGNTVVMSMNQITDSKAFLCMLQDEKHYSIIRELFQRGYIRISRYGEVRTASQYVQNAISKNLAKNEDVFIFSALPVKSKQKRLLKLMQQVLVNADLSRIKEYGVLITKGSKKDCDKVLELFNEYCIEETDKVRTISIEQAKQYLTLLYRFLELILWISMYDTSANPPIRYDDTYPNKDFCKMMEEILSLDYKPAEAPLWKESVNILENIKQHLEVQKKGEGKNNRSVWLKQIKQLEGSESKQNLQYAELIVDLCYNYTVEWSIYGTSKHYKREKEGTSFQREFLDRLINDWNNGSNAEQRFLQEETNEYKQYNKQYPDWEQGMRLISKRKKHTILSRVPQYIPLYEYHYKEERKEKKKEDILNILKIFISVFVYVIVIYAMDKMMSLAEEYVGIILKSFITFLVLTFISDIIDKLLPIPNIVECLELMKMSVIDLTAIIRRKSATYINDENLSDDTKEEVPQILEDIPLKPNALKEYMMLSKNYPELFKSSTQIEIVEPNKKGIEEILNYETKYNLSIGVVYKSKYNMLVVDLIRGKDGGYYTYERLVPTVQKGAVVVVPIYQGRFILLNQFRHAMRENQLAFPRGYGEMTSNGEIISQEENALKEIQEELGAEVIGNPKQLGSVIADSGISGNPVMVYSVEIKQYKENKGYEGIEEIQLKTTEEMSNCIKNNEINDGFTLAAYMLYLLSQ